MNKSDNRFLIHWEEKRKQGPVKFSLITGVTYAVFVIVFSKIFAWNWSFTEKDLGYGIVSLVIGVFALAPFMWWLRERRYKKLMAQKPNKNKKKGKK